MLQPSKKQSIEKRAVYLQDPARLGNLVSQHDLNQKRLKQEGISWFQDSENHRTNRNRTDNDQTSVVSAAKPPKALQGHNKFDKLKHWNIPTHQRARRRPKDIYIPGDGGSLTSTIDSPLGGTRRQTHTSNITNNDSDSKSDNNVGEKPLIGSRVAVLRGIVIHFGKIISWAMVEDRKHYCIKHDDRSIENVNSMELSRLQELYIQEMNNDAVGQQKQKARSQPDNENVGTRVSFICVGVVFYVTVKRCFLND